MSYQSVYTGIRATYGILLPHRIFDYVRYFFRNRHSSHTPFKGYWLKSEGPKSLEWNRINCNAMLNERKTGKETEELWSLPYA
mgnify:CR=1 FL=1